MTKIEIECLSQETNAAVVRLPWRKFPGIVLQGDSLKVLLDAASEVAKLSRGSDVPELEDAAVELVGILGTYVQGYEDALLRHNQPLPYVKESPRAG